MSRFEQWTSEIGSSRSTYWATTTALKLYTTLIVFNSIDNCDVTMLGNLLHFGQLFKVIGNNYLVQIAHICRQFLKSCQNLSFF